jgi:hypothetical protein
MISKIKNKKSGLSAQAGFIKLIIVIVIALLLMRYFHITITGILAYFHLTWPEIMNWFQQSLNWFKDLFNSVK